MNAIDCQSVQVTLGKQKILKSVSVAIPCGVCFGLVGENGAGKSTLIKTILDLVGMDSGNIRLLEQDNTLVSSRACLAYLPDRFTPPYYLTGKDFLNYIYALYGNTQAPDWHECLQQLDLHESALLKSVKALSKGMTQKLGLTACFNSGKPLLILDEPMSGLDPRARILVKQQIKKLTAQGTTVFFSSHMLGDVEEIADQMAVMYAGEIRFEGTPEVFKQTFAEETMEQAYLKCIDKL